MSLPDDDISEVLVSQDDIRKRTKELGSEINKHYSGKDLMLIGVLRGAFVFISDLIRNISSRCSVDFVATSSYGLSGTKSSGNVKLLKDLSDSVKGKDLLLVDDILDSGTTLDFLINLLKVREPSSINLCVLLSKPSKLKKNISAKYVGFTIPDKFVVGYGLGYNEEYRNLPYVGVLKESIWANN